MRIGIDARLPFFRRGGISESVVNLIEALGDVRDTDDQFVVLQARGDKHSLVPADAPGFSRANVDTPCHHPYERLLLAAEIAPLGLDVLHSPDFIPPVSGAARRMITVHDLGCVDYPEHFTPESLRHYGGQLEWAVGSADVITTPSEFVRRRLLDRFNVPAEKVVAIHPAAATRYSQPPDSQAVHQTLARHGLRAGYVLFVGTLEPRKNVMTLIEAHDAIRAARLSDAPLVLVGPDGWLADDVVRAVDERRGSVYRAGEISSDELTCFYAGAGVLALPSIHEGFGFPVIEAMHCGCPVVASTGGALPETAGDAALLVDPFDVARWAEALSAVLNDAALRTSLVTRGAARVQRFSWRTTALRTLAQYRGSVE